MDYEVEKELRDLWHNKELGSILTGLVDSYNSYDNKEKTLNAIGLLVAMKNYLNE